jgi:hypothetical protein
LFFPVLFKDAIHLIPECFKPGGSHCFFRDTMEKLPNMQSAGHFFVAGFPEPWGNAVMADPQAEMPECFGAERHT